MNKSKAQPKLMMEWNEIDWRKAEVKTFKLQKRIFQASERGDVKAVRKLQKTLIRSWSARALAVKRVTQDNQGKKTAGVDGPKSKGGKDTYSNLQLLHRHCQCGSFLAKMGNIHIN